jgi:hypothetical protein
LIAILIAGCTSQPQAEILDGGAPGPYGGGGMLPIDSAASKYPDLRTFWSRSVARTCGPNNGVCHDNRQFPDMQTVSGLLDAVNARCNQIRQDPATVDNLCEAAGDQLTIGPWKSRIGRVIAGATSLTVTLKDKIPKGTSGALAVVRARDGLPPVTFAIPAAANVSASGSQVMLDRTVLADPKQAPGPGGTAMAPASMADFLAPAAYTPGDENQVQLGDPNGDGLFGADLGGAVVKPGAPMKSYLFLRVLSPLAVGNNPNTSMTAPASMEAQMPIANFQYWDVDNDLTALWCWISGMKPDGSNADGPIDYAHCDTSQMPTPMHQGGEASTFSSVYAGVLQPRCATCHYTGNKMGTTFYMDELQSTYDLLLGIRGSGPSENQLGLPYVTKSDPTKSYLYLKITGDPAITGAKMPLGGELPQSAIDAVQTWIAQGANND